MDARRGLRAVRTQNLFCVLLVKMIAHFEMALR